MSSSQDAIKRVVEAFERSEWSEIDVRSGNLRVHLSTSSPNGATAISSTTTHTPNAAAAPADLQRDTSAPPSADSPPPGAHVVVSPTPGIFWRSPDPGSPPFADVGQTADASSTVCIIEVMKLMTHVKAGVGGRVVAVYGQNGVAVHKGQVLFAIEPSGASA